MSLEDQGKNWDALGRIDPMYAILADPKKKGRKWQAEEFFGTGATEIAELMSQLNSMGLGVSRRKALDFGCGIGRLSQALAHYFEEVHGVDIAPSMIHLAREYNSHGKKCIYHPNQSPSLKLFADDTFDLVYSRFTLQHIEPDECGRYIQEFVRVLAHSGALVFQLPSPPVDSLKKRVKRVLPATVLRMYRWMRYRRWPVTGMYGIERERVIRLLAEAGGRIVKITPDEEGWASLRYFVTKP